MKKQISKLNLSDYSDETKNYITNVLKFLKKKFNTVNEEWYSVLLMLADNHQMFLDCKAQIKKDGLMVTDRFGALTKHPLLKVQNDAQIQAVKLLNEFGLTPKALSKIELKDTDDYDDSIISQFIA